MFPYESRAGKHACYVFQAQCYDKKVTFALSIETEDSSGTDTIVTAVTSAAMWLFEFSMAHFCSNSRRARLWTSSHIHCLSLRLSIHIRPTQEHALHQEYRTCHRLSGPCVCLQAGIPKIKQIIIADSSQPNHAGREENMWFLTHCFQSMSFFVLILPNLPSLSVSLAPSEEGGVVHPLMMPCSV